MRSFYEVLGVRRNATYEEIVVAYRRRVLETHPDRGGNTIEFLNVRKGFEILSNEKKRTEYDQWLAQKEATEFAKRKQERTPAPVTTEARIRLMPYIEVLLEYHCKSQKLTEYVLNVCHKIDEVFLNIDIRTDKSIQAAIVIKKCVHIIRKAHVFRWEDVLDSLSTSCDSIIYKAEPPYKQRESKEKRKMNDTNNNKFFVLLGCITLVVSFLSITLISRNLTKDVERVKIEHLNHDNSEEDVLNNRKRVYDILKEQTGYIDSYEDFNKAFDASEDNRKRVYDVLKERTGYIDSYEDFNKGMGYSHVNNDQQIKNIQQTNLTANATDKQKENLIKSKKLILYETLTKDGYDLGDYNSFCINIDDSNVRRNFYEVISRHYDLGSYEEFSSKLDEESTMPIRIVDKHTSKDSHSLSSNNLSYSETYFNTGNSPYKEYYGLGEFDSESLSELTILNYSNNDAIVLLCTLGNRVIRNIFIGQNSSYSMKNIPEGKYIVKIMSGKSWNKEKNNGPGLPKGGFMENISFSKTEEHAPFDYTFERNKDGIRYPTYSITLHKVRNGNLHAKNISKEDFFS